MNFKNVTFIDFESKNNLTQKTWLVILMAVLVYISYVMFTSFFSAFAILLYSIKNSSSVMELLELEWFKLLSLFLTIVGIAITLLYVKFIERRPLSTTGITKKRFAINYSTGYLLGILLIGLPVLILILSNGTVVVNTPVDYKILALYFLGFIVQGASEEIMIRGYLLTSLAKNVSIFWAILISSLGFASLHLLNPNMGALPFVNLVLFGIFASLFFLRTKNIWAISGIHSAWNFFQGNIFGIEVSGQTFGYSLLSIKSAAPEILTGGEFGLEGGLIITILLIASSLICAFCGKNKLILKNNTINSVV